jgi:hypothetical protein
MMRFVEGGGNTSWLEFQLNDDANEEFRIYGYSCSGYGCAEISGNLYHWFRSNGEAYHRSNLFVGGEVQAPIFRDSNNGGYYGDFASTSRMNAIVANIYSLNDGWDIYDDNASVMSIRSNNSDNGRIYFRDSNSTVCGSIYFDDDNHWGLQTPSNEWALYMERDARVYMYYNGTWEIRTASGHAEARGEFRAQNFRDTNNSGYFADPASTSRLNVVDANEVYSYGWLRTRYSGRGVYNQQTGQHFYSDDDDGWNVAGGGGANWIRMRDQYASTIRGYFYADSGSNVGILNSGGSWRLRIVSGDYMLYYGSSIRAPRFYDSNSTFYYTDPASTSRMNAIQCYGTIQSRTNITAYASFSDIRKKENIDKIENALDKVSQLNGYHFNYIGDDTRLTGVIAQEVEKVLPGIVYEADDLDNPEGGTTKAVRYGQITALLIESTKEQQDIINKQQEQIDEQKKEIDKLSEMVKMLMNKLDK